MKKLLIIAGTTKAGTSALHEYLSQHLKINATINKESRFFLDRNYPVRMKSIYDYNKGLDQYFKFFNIKRDEDSVLLDTTPDYMYSPVSSGLIKQFKNKFDYQVKVIFILRDPVERFFSWYNFGKQMGDIPEEMTLDQYIELSISYRDKHNNALTALEKGKYSHYIKPYIKDFEKENIKIIPYTSLKENPLDVLIDISKYINIEEDFFYGISLGIHNKTINVKNKYLFFFIKLMRQLKRKLNSKIFNSIINLFSVFWRYIITKSTKEIEHNFVRDYQRKKIVEYYRDEELKLKELFPDLKKVW